MILVIDRAISYGARMDGLSCVTISFKMCASPRDTWFVGC